MTAERLKSINLAISTLCGADCIFCPDDRAKNMKERVMSFDIAKKVIDEISTRRFRSKHNVRVIELGENGDAFMNKDFIEILRYLKTKLPLTRKSLCTNFQYFTPDKIDAVLKENWCNT